MVDTFTGLPAPWMYSLFANTPEHSENSAVQKNEVVAGYIEAGKGKATEATILKTDGRTRIMTSGQDGSIYDLTLDNTELMPRGVISWREVLDMGFTLPPEIMTKGLEP
jgi:hypothetical protein